MSLTNCGIKDDLFVNEFRIFVPEYDITTKIQTVLLPEIQTENIELGKGNLKYKSPGERLEFSKLVFDTIMDADADNYRKFYNWMVKSTLVPQDSLTDVIIQLMNPTLFEPVVELRYEGCFVTALAPQALDITQSEVMRFTANISVTNLVFD